MSVRSRTVPLPAVARSDKHHGSALHFRADAMHLWASGAPRQCTRQTAVFPGRPTAGPGGSELFVGVCELWRRAQRGQCVPGHARVGIGPVLTGTGRRRPAAPSPLLSPCILPNRRVWPLLVAVPYACLSRGQLDTALWQEPQTQRLLDVRRAPGAACSCLTCRSKAFTVKCQVLTCWSRIENRKAT